MQTILEPKLNNPKLSSSNSQSLFRGNQPSLWNFWEHGVTSSFLNLYLQCRESCRLYYVEGWTPKHTPIYFEFGLCVHWLLERAYSCVRNKNPEPWPAEDIETCVNIWLEQYNAKWLEEMVMPATKQLQQQQYVYKMAAAAVLGYMQRWDADFWGGEYTYGTKTVLPHCWLSLEEEFCVPYAFPDGRQTFIRGRRDGVFADTQAKFWHNDTKCLSYIKDNDILDCMPFDLQQNVYLWVDHVELSQQIGTKIYPDGMCFNVIRRPSQKQKKNESQDDFYARIAADLSDPSQFDWNFIRYEMKVTSSEIGSYKARVLDPLMREVRAWWEGRLPHYINPSGLRDKYGRNKMFDLLTRNDSTFFFKRDKPFSELSEV